MKKSLDKKKMVSVGRLRELLYSHMPGGPSGYLKKTMEDIELIDKPIDRVRAKLQLMEFFMPKMKAVEVTTDGPRQAIQLNFHKDDGTTQIIQSTPSELEQAIDIALEDDNTIQEDT